MKKMYWSTLLSLTAILAMLATPAFAAQDGTVIASAVVVPSQTTRMSFLTPGLVKEVAVQEGDQVTEGQMLITLNAPDLEYNVIAAQEAFRAAEANAELQRYKRVLDIRKGKKFWDVVPPEVRQRADAQAASAQAVMEAAQAAALRSTLVAPSNATVASINVISGEFVQQGQVAILLASLDNLQIETTDLSERDIARVKLGAPVSISIEALEETVSGTVTGISPIADTVGGDVVFKVTITLDEQPEGLLWGMTAEVQIGE